LSRVAWRCIAEASSPSAEKLRGRKPDKIERLSESHVRITIMGESFEVPLALMRLY
jgi:hypothetical protein